MWTYLNSAWTGKVSEELFHNLDEIRTPLSKTKIADMGLLGSCYACHNQILIKFCADGLAPDCNTADTMELAQSCAIKAIGMTNVLNLTTHCCFFFGYSSNQPCLSNLICQSWAVAGVFHFVANSDAAAPWGPLGTFAKSFWKTLQQKNLNGKQPWHVKLFPLTLLIFSYPEES